MNIWLRNTHSSQLHLHFSHIAMHCRATKIILTLDGEEGHYDLDFGDDDNKEKVLLLSRERAVNAQLAQGKADSEALNLQG